MNGQFLDFKTISQVPFKDFLDWLQVTYEETEKGELKGKTERFSFIANISKNLFLCPHSEATKGSVINFLSELEGIGLRESAKRIKARFLDKQPPPKRDIPELKLEYHKYLIDNDVTFEQAQKGECGYCGQRSIMAGKIAFKVRDVEGKVVGYVGINPEDDSWFFPKGFKRDHLYNLHRIKDSQDFFLTDNFITAIKNDALCLMGKSMTEEQENLLKKYARSVTLIHPSPENLVQRISKFCFVRVYL